MEVYELHRLFKVENAILGHLYTPGKQKICVTLEDLTRDVKIKSQTSIPAGLYVVQKTYSPRFKQMMCLIYNQPDKSVFSNGQRFTGVRIHWGNYAKDTDGCILVGEQMSGAMITNSKATYKKVFNDLPDLFYLNIINYIQ